MPMPSRKVESAAHDRATPKVERVRFVGPKAGRTILRTDFQIARDLGQIAVRISYHEESVVSRPVPPNTPCHGDPDIGHVVSPCAQFVPAVSFTGEVIEPTFRRAEDRKCMVFSIGAKKNCAQGSFGIANTVGNRESQLLRIEVGQNLRARRANSVMLKACTG